MLYELMILTVLRGDPHPHFVPMKENDHSPVITKLSRNKCLDMANYLNGLNSRMVLLHGELPNNVEFQIYSCAEEAAH